MRARVAKPIRLMLKRRQDSRELLDKIRNETNHGQCSKMNWDGEEYIVTAGFPHELLQK